MSSPNSPPKPAAAGASSSDPPPSPQHQIPPPSPTTAAGSASSAGNAQVTAAAASGATMPSISFTAPAHGHGHGNSQWHTIRPAPWSPRLALQVKEITSVSATFLLSTRSSSPDDAHFPHEHHGHDHHTSTDDDTIFHDDIPSPSDVLLLGRELAVKVNGTAWVKILVDVSDDGEDATIVLYGLMPARHYEVELSVLSNKDRERPTIATIVNVSTEIESNEESSPTSEFSPELPGAIPLPSVSYSSSSNNNPFTSTPPKASSSSPSTTIPIQSQVPESHPLSHPNGTHPHHRHITPDDRASQLRHTLSLLQAEKETLQTTLKNLRRDMQRNEAALRAEMEGVKRAAEKQASTETRFKQKVLALQEAVKQAKIGCESVENEADEVTSALPSLQKELDETEGLHSRTQSASKNAVKDSEIFVAKEHKRLSDAQAELVSLKNRLEKIVTRKERVEREVLPDVVAELRITRAERREKERTMGIPPGRDSFESMRESGYKRESWDSLREREVGAKRWSDQFGGGQAQAQIGLPNRVGLGLGFGVGGSGGGPSSSSGLSLSLGQPPPPPIGLTSIGVGGSPTTSPLESISSNPIPTQNHSHNLSPTSPISHPHPHSHSHHPIQPPNVRHNSLPGPQQQQTHPSPLLGKPKAIRRKTSVEAG